MSMSKDDLINQFKKFLEFNDYEEKDVDEDLINEFFTDVFYDVEDEKDIDASNDAEEEIRRKYLGESKKVEEMKLQEANESKYKQRFIDYCKGKVEDLGTLQVINDDYDEEYDDEEDKYTEYQIGLISSDYDQANPAYVLFPEDDDVLKVADKDGNLIVDNAMSDIIEEAKEMSFDKIDTSLYDEIIEYWDEHYMDDAMELDDVDKSQREKIEREFKCPKGFYYNVISRNGGADVEVYCDDIRDLKATTTTMKDTEYVQDYFDIDGLWEVNIVDENGNYKGRVYANGWREAMDKLKDEYNKVKGKKQESKKITESEEKNQSELEHTINVWAIDEENLRFEDPEELAEVYFDALSDTGELEGFGYTEADKEEVLNIIENVIYDVQDQVGDIYTIAENYDGNMSNDTLEDEEWQQIYENAPEIFKDALRARADYMADSWGTVPDRVWDWLDRSVDEQIGFNGYNPAFIIDNVLVNGSYGDFDDFKDENETDEEFIEREQDNCLEIYPEERFIIYSI